MANLTKRHLIKKTVLNAETEPKGKSSTEVRQLPTLNPDVQGSNCYFQL